MTDRQLDIMATRSDFFTLPTHAPGRLDGTMFVYFNWPREVDPRRYTVVIETLDTAGAPYRGISPLKDHVQLPHVQLGWHPRIGVVPDSEELPVFEGELVRGSTYDIPNPPWKQGRVIMRRSGVHRPPGI